MRKLLTAEQMRETDRFAIQKLGIPGIVLMENAGRAVADQAERMLENCRGGKVLILCGKGNNGGDGFVAGRHLANRGFEVLFLLAGDRKEIRGDARTNLEITESMGLPVVRTTGKKSLLKISRPALIIDALLGTGFSGKVRSAALDAIRWINGSGVPVLSVDVPSGLNCDDGTFNPECVQADATVTLAEIKRGCILPPGREKCGSLTVADIGMPRFIRGAASGDVFLLQKEDIGSWLPERPPDAHKGRFGKILFLAGSTGMTGAAVLSTTACLRSGAGLVLLGIPAGLNVILEQKCTEVLTRPLPSTPEGGLSLEAESEILRLLSWADVLAIGPGLGSHSETRELVRRVMRRCRLPMVIDADGLNALAGFTDWKSLKAVKILTPHFGELSRLTGLKAEEIEKNRFAAVREWSGRFGSILVLKGSPTLIGVPAGEIYVSCTGHSGMATAGSGDVLTGMIAGFLGQACGPLEAAACGVFLHGLSGDLAAEKTGRRSLMAGDLIQGIPDAFRHMETAGGRIARWKDDRQVRDLNRD
ncbi:NAD(P)H-hydrate dehydratase [bacterium]|nr:NAD(P)H-hydrate dehydratase [bacterium]